MAHYVYIIQSLADGTYYVGSTQNIAERLQRHNQGRSQYTKSKRPWELVHSEEHLDRSAAVIRENEIKKRKSQKFIESLIKTSSSTSI
jgi:putative endonuclease